MCQGSTVQRGETLGFVTATGRHSFFGKAATLVDSVDRAGNFQRVLLFVARFLLALALCLVTIIFFVIIFGQHGNVAKAIKDFKNPLEDILYSVAEGELMLSHLTGAVRMLFREHPPVPCCILCPNRQQASLMLTDKGLPICIDRAQCWHWIQTNLPPLRGETTAVMSSWPFFQH